MWRLFLLRLFIPSGHIRSLTLASIFLNSLSTRFYPYPNEVGGNFVIDLKEVRIFLLIFLLKGLHSLQPERSQSFHHFWLTNLFLHRSQTAKLYHIQYQSKKKQNKTKKPVPEEISSSFSFHLCSFTNTIKEQWNNNHNQKIKALQRHLFFVLLYLFTTQKSDVLCFPVNNLSLIFSEFLSLALGISMFYFLFGFLY